MIKLSKEIQDLASAVSEEIRPRFEEIDKVAEINTAKVMEAFQKNRVSEGCFAGTTGYGYDDKGREVLDQIYADIFHTEAGLVRIGFVNGTHAISSAFFGALRPGDTLLSATGIPYDTLQSVIGISGNYPGSLRDYNIDFQCVDLTPDGVPDIPAISRAASNRRVKAVAIQRSRGYALRKSLSVSEIGEICRAVRAVNPGAAIIVDNCYGEFVDTVEPTDVGADMAAGSLIKNPGGGLAPTGGYVVGRRDLVEAASMRLTTPGIGGECGSTLGMSRLLFQGLFMAPHTVAQALKTAIFCAGMMEKMGFDTLPKPLEPRSDIIQTIVMNTPENLKLFCKGIQSGAPVDAYVTPEPWAMPGYEDQVIMAAGAFVQGASIELSADGPMRPPYCAFLQGGLTYESGKLGVLLASELLNGALEK